MIWSGIALLFGAGICVAAITHMITESRKPDADQLVKLKEELECLKKAHHVFNYEFMEIPIEEVNKEELALKQDEDKLIARSPAISTGNKRARTPEERQAQSARMFRRWAEKRARDALEGQTHPAPQKEATPSQAGHGA